MVHILFLAILVRIFLQALLGLLMLSKVVAMQE